MGDESDEKAAVEDPPAEAEEDPPAKPEEDPPAEAAEEEDSDGDNTRALELVTSLLGKLKERKVASGDQLERLDRTLHQSHIDNIQARKEEDAQELIQLEKDIEDAQRQLEEKRRQYNQLEKKWIDMDYDFRKLKGQFDQLLSMIYSQSESVAVVYTRRIRKILRKKDSKKLGGVSDLLGRNAGKEHELYLKVCQKYKWPNVLPEYKQLSKAEPPAILRRLSSQLDFGDWTPTTSPRKRREKQVKEVVGTKGRALKVKEGKHVRLPSGMRAELIQEQEEALRMLEPMEEGDDEDY